MSRDSTRLSDGQFGHDLMELETRQGFARFFLRGGFKNDDAHRVLILTVNI